MADILASVSVVLGAEVSQFKAAMAEARRELKGLREAGEAAKDIGTAMTKYISLPVAGLGVGVLKVGGDFQAAFNRVQASTQAAGADLLALRQKAQDIALDPNLKFSSIQAAQAIENLSKNGAEVRDILGGAVDATTALATATGAQLATAADITTDVMNNFGKSAQQAAGLVSNITGATIASKFSIDDYRMALGQAGAVAGQLGVAFEDFNTALSVTSSGFSSGSDAGTSFKTFLQRLVPQSKEAEQAIKQLGLNFFDAQGKMRPLREIAGELQKAFKDLSDEQKNKLGTQAFGSDSIRTALLLAKEGTAGFDRMAESIGKVNAASQGTILNQGFTGGLEAFKSALEGLGQAIADSGLLSFADGVLRQAASAAAGLAQLNPAVLNTGVVLAGFAAATGPALVALGTLGAAMPAIRAGFVELQLATTLLQNNMVALRGALAAVLSPAGAMVAVAVTLGAVIYAASTESERAYASFQKQTAATRQLDNSLTPLLDRYDQLKSKTSLSATEQQELRNVVQQVTAIMPEAGTKIDQYGNFIDIAAEKARKSVASFQGIDKAIALANLPQARGKLKDLEESYGRLQRAAVAVNETGKLNGVALSSLGAKGAAENLGYLRDDIAKVGEELDKQRQQVQDFEAAAGILATTVGGKLTQALTDADIALKFFGNGGGGVSTQVGLLAGLREQLEAVRKARETEGTDAAVFADNKRIKSIQAEIDRLEQTSKAGKKTTDAIAALRLELSRLTALDNLLGNTPSEVEVLERRAATLTTGLKGLIDAGVSPTSKAFKAFAQDLVTASQAADRILAGIGKNKPDGDLLGLKPVEVKSLIPRTIGDTLAPDVARLLGDYAKQAKPFELPVQVKLAIQGSVSITNQLNGVLGKELLNIGAAFRQIDGASQLGIEFDAAGAKAAQLQASMRQLLAEGFGPASQEMQDFSRQFKELALNSQVAQALKSSIMDLASGISDAFASALSGTQSIGNVLLQTLLSTVGNLATQLGSIILSAGLGIEALKTSLANFTGVGAIAAGLGLLAIGGIAKGAAANLGKSGSSSASTPSTGNYGQSTNQAVVKVIAEFRLRGEDLVAVGRSANYRSEVSG